MQDYFKKINQIVAQHIKNNEQYNIWFSAEYSDFARFNKAKIRQIGNVEQAYLEIRLIKNEVHACSTIGLSKNLQKDQELIILALNKLRDFIANSPKDPYFLINQTDEQTCNIYDAQFDKNEIINDVLEISQGLDLVGYYCGGTIYKAYASSYGQINWFEKPSFFIDTSVYHSSDKAIKQLYADNTYEKQRFIDKINETKKALEIFSQPTKSLSPKKYTVYFSPNAVFELLSMLNWGGFSQKALEVKSSPLLPLMLKEKSLHPSFSLTEDMSYGIGPNFQKQGFIKPASTDLIKNGNFISGMISPKTAKEYNLKHNSADEDESFVSLSMQAGDLASKDIYQAVGDGLYINNLWYLNFSDRYQGRITGMTRFFCYMIENSKPSNYFSVMRFDDSIYRIFGEKILAITKEREMIIDTSTYDERATSCAILPGIIAQDVSFTL